jgi:hypothetical protein
MSMPTFLPASTMRQDWLIIFSFGSGPAGIQSFSVTHLLARPADWPPTRPSSGEAIS